MILTSSIYEGKALKDASGFDTRLNKVVALNSTNRLFFRTYPVIDMETGMEIPNKYQVIAPLVPGYSCDFNVCGTSFFVLDGSQVEYNPETKECKDLSGLKEWARICRVLHEAAEANEKYAARELLTANAKRIGKDIDQASLKEAIDKIEVEYRGGKDILGNKIHPIKHPIISNIQLKMTTQCLVVPMDKEGKPDWDNARTAYIELSKEKLDSIVELLNDPKYCGGTTGFLEVEYKYMGADTKEAGRKAKFQGVTRDNSLEVCFPELFQARGVQALNKLVEGADINATAELIAARNISLRVSKTVKDIEASIRNYCSKESGVIASINTESDDTKKIAKSLLELGLVDEVPRIKDSLQELIAAADAEKANAGESVTEQVLDEVDKQEQQVIEAVSEMGRAAGSEALQQASFDINALNSEIDEDDM